MLNQLLNANEKIPDEFYVFVNVNNVIVHHNLSTKRFISGAFAQLQFENSDFTKKYIAGDLDYLPFVPNNATDVETPSMFQNSVTSNYHSEYNAELYRMRNVKTFPSRLSALYAFGDIASCELVREKYKWQSPIMKFKLLPHPCNRVVKVNMEIVSLIRHANNVSAVSHESTNAMWEQYWNGEGDYSASLPTVGGHKDFSSGVIWEYLIEGCIELIE